MKPRCIDAVIAAVGRALPALMRRFRFADAAAVKGSAARVHFGAVAQEVRDLFAEHGLDAAQYGVWCEDTWIEQDGTVCTRQGIRYDELMALVVSALAH